MRAGLDGPGPVGGFEAMLQLRGHGFVLQPTDTARAVTDCTYHVQLVRARLPGGSAVPRLALAECKDTSVLPMPRLHRS